MTTQKNWQRPDGTRAADYKLDSFTNEDIAFEVVRRSPQYLTTCAKVDNGELDPQLAADSAGLYRFKHAYEAREDGYGRPRFKAATASLYRHHKGKKYRRVPVEWGRVAIVVSLEEMRQSNKAERYMVEQVVAELLKDEVQRFLALPGPPAPRPEKPEGAYRTQLEACLQVSDLDSGKKPDAEIVQMVPYLKLVAPRSPGDDKEPARTRLRDIRRRNIRLFEKLEITNILLHKS